MDLWNDIKNKPETRKFVLVYCPLYDNILEAYWDGCDWKLADSDKVLNDYTLGYPTDWMELPKRPKKT